MKAAVYERYGPPEVVTVKEVAKPAIKDNEVLVKIRATTVSSGDWRARSLAVPAGFKLMSRLFFGVFRPRQPILGTEFAGDVAAVGKDVTRFKVGDAVFGYPGAAFGCHAEYRAMPADGSIALKPANLSYQEAAALCFGGTTALDYLKDKGKIARGEKVLIVGASGTVGSAAVQLAKHFGAEVTAVCGPANLALVKSIGADHVIDYTKEDFTRSGRRYDVILDMADDRSLPDRRRALTPNGTLIPNSGRGNRFLGSLGRIIWARMASLVVSQSFRPFLSTQNRDDLLALRRLLEDGSVRPIVGERHPLDDAAAAVTTAGGGHATGKVVIVV